MEFNLLHIRQISTLRILGSEQINMHGLLQLQSGIGDETTSETEPSPEYYSSPASYRKGHISEDPLNAVTPPPNREHLSMVNYGFPPTLTSGEPYLLPSPPALLSGGPRQWHNNWSSSHNEFDHYYNLNQHGSPYQHYLHYNSINDSPFPDRHGSYPVSDHHDSIFQEKLNRYHFMGKSIEEDEKSPFQVNLNNNSICEFL